MYKLFIHVVEISPTLTKDIDTETFHNKASRTLSAFMFNNGVDLNKHFYAWVGHSIIMSYWA